MRLPISLTTIAMALSLPFAVQAQTPGMQDNAPPPPQTGEIALKATSAPLAKEREAWVRVGQTYLVHNVSKPTLTPFLPPSGKGNGTAVVIAPGGGFMMLSISGEGYDVARWLASQGIAAFVLKYRLTATPPTATGLMGTLSTKLSAPGGFQSSQWFADGTRVAVEDAAEAMRVVRANAVKWQIDPKKVGFMGFSAGAFTTLGLVNRSDPATMPAFIAPIYGSMNTPTQPLPSALPPMWASMAADDPLLGKTDFGLLAAWRAKGGSTEFHLYDKGGHGYGFAGTAGTTTTNWPSDFLAWLREHKFAS